MRHTDGSLNPDAPLSGRTALITGSGSPLGIGFAIARRLAGDGARVFLTSTTDRCHERASSLLTQGVEASAHPADLTRVDEIEALLARVFEVFGSVELLVNNAGMTSVGDAMGAPRPTHEFVPADWDHIIERNLHTAFGVTSRVLPQMSSGGFGRIVNVASTTGVTGAMFGESAYAAAKAGLVGFTRAIALEYAAQGITCNAVAPGWIATGSQTADESRQGAAVPVGRSGTADEVAHVVAMLCAPAASYITGQCLVIDGGNSIAEERAVR